MVCTSKIWLLPSPFRIGREKKETEKRLVLETKRKKERKNLPTILSKIRESWYGTFMHLHSLENRIGKIEHSTL